ncbi:hypothetical protein B484DRAFT_393795 [Ochromonadaceae sp. CCMP2298]|nr:hypothetical protein B484DRAFT_393795 [Ochromonadaceae sp. CCMP2298]
MGRVGYRDSTFMTSIVRRDLSLNNEDRKYVKELVKILQTIAFVERASEPEPIAPRLMEVKEILPLKYQKMRLTDEVPERVRRKPVFIRIDDITGSEIYQTYLFTKPELHRLYRCLRLDEFPVITMDNGAKFGGEERVH